MEYLIGLRVPIPVNFDKLHNNLLTGAYDNTAILIPILSAVIAFSYFIFIMYKDSKQKRVSIFSALFSSLCNFIISNIIIRYYIFSCI